MCNLKCLEFVRDNVRSEEVEGKDILESGSRNVNGSVRSGIEALHPRKYIGTDIEKGPSVDRICDAVDLVAIYGENSFDMLISTEMIEHCTDWLAVITNFKRILRPDGTLFITTRSRGFPYHGYPADHWRYEVADMKVIFEDFEILDLRPDPYEPGVFIKARKPKRFKEKDLSGYWLYPMRLGGQQMIGNAPHSHLTGVPGWEATDEQDYLLKCAVEVPDGGQIVELGGEFGMSTSIFCKGAKPGVTITTVDTFSGDLLDHHRANLAEAGFANRSKQIQSTSVEAGHAWKGGDIDLLFIDADHTYEGAKGDIEAWLGHIKNSGIVVFHDMAQSTNPLPHLLHFEVTKAVNEWYSSAVDWRAKDNINTIASYIFADKPSSAPVKKAVKKAK